LKNTAQKDMFSDRRSQNRRASADRTPEDGCRRQKPSDRRQSPSYYDRQWWLHASYVDSELYL
jgi:hypothetical protein